MNATWTNAKFRLLAALHQLVRLLLATCDVLQSKLMTWTILIALLTFC